MYGLLTQHPQILAATQKELNFFRYQDEPMSDYVTYFPNRTAGNPDAISLDASVRYVRYPWTRDKLYATFPCATIVFLMRDPAVRWWSHFQYSARRCSDPDANGACLAKGISFEALLPREMAATKKLFERVGFTRELQEAGISFFSMQHGSQVPTRRTSFTLGLYYSRMKYWLEVWPRSQVLLVNMEEYFHPATLNEKMQEITDFVGLPRHQFNAIPPDLPMGDATHTAPGDYGPLPEPYNTQVRAFYEPDLKLLKKHFGITFAAPVEAAG
jgi:hypothetical protein